jgi:tetratricopeptide (TPR) repeat protein
MAMKNNDAASICRYSSNILEIIPEDYTASYSFAFGQYMHGNLQYLYDFLSSNQSLYTYEELDSVLSHLFEYGSLGDKSKIEAYLRSLTNIDTDSALNVYNRIYNKRKEAEDRYDIYPRDVFLCYHDDNRRIAERIAEIFETDGLQCWAAFRNIRPGGMVSQRDIVRAAIESCKIFVVISDEAAMYSQHVKEQMNTAHVLGKERLEFKIDMAPYTNFFACFFGGIPWVEGMRFDNCAVKSLSGRVSEMLNGGRALPKPQRTADSYNIGEILRTAQDYCTVGDYDSALKIYRNLTETNPDNYRVWLGMVRVITKCFTDADDTAHLPYLERAFRVANEAEKSIINSEYAPIADRRRYLLDMYGRASGDGSIKF